MLYIIKTKGAFKVGISRNPKMRLSELQTGSASKLTIEFTLPDAFDCCEKPLHYFLGRYSTDGGSEWFVDAGYEECLAELERLCRKVIADATSKVNEVFVESAAKKTIIAPNTNVKTRSASVIDGLAEYLHMDATDTSIYITRSDFNSVISLIEKNPTSTRIGEIKNTLVLAGFTDLGKLNGYRMKQDDGKQVSVYRGMQLIQHYSGKV